MSEDINTEKEKEFSNDEINFDSIDFNINPFNDNSSKDVDLTSKDMESKITISNEKTCENSAITSDISNLNKNNNDNKKTNNEKEEMFKLNLNADSYFPKRLNQKNNGTQNPIGEQVFNFPNFNTINNFNSNNNFLSQSDRPIINNSDNKYIFVNNNYNINIINKKENYSKPQVKKNDNKYKTKKAQDWICNRCFNLNYSFRIFCNICQLSKNDNMYYFPMMNFGAP